MTTINSLRPTRNAKGQFVGKAAPAKAAPKAASNGRNGKGQFVKGTKATPAATPASKAAPKAERVWVIRDPESPCTFPQRVKLAKLTGSTLRDIGDITKGQASAMISAILADQAAAS